MGKGGHWLRGFVALFGVLASVLAIAVPMAYADPPATYTATETIPVPPASSFAGSGGGDGWAVALTSTAVYNVFHHNSELDVACHVQADASQCWDSAYKRITDADGSDFATSGHPGLWLDQTTGKLYVFVTRESDDTGGVACVDTTQPASNPDPFCGFTPLTAAGEATYTGVSAISNPVLIGSRLYAFDFYPGSGVSGAKNTLLCFDVTSLAACHSQPYTLSIGQGQVSVGDEPSPAVAAIGDRIIVPVSVDNSDELACYDTSTTDGACSGSWPVPLNFFYSSGYGAPFPLLTSSGAVQGFCLPSYTNTDATDPCYGLDGASVQTPAGMTDAITPTSGWNGPALVLGPRVYVPDGQRDQVTCYDYSTSASCSGFPKQLSNLGLLYTVNSDPQRPTCIWVNSDDGSAQIQNFDAYTGGACGQGPVRVLASSVVAPQQACLPLGYSSLQVISPSPGSYSGGSVQFEDFDGNPLNIPEKSLDGNGTVDLTGLNLNSNGLPEFLITLNGTQGTPQSVVIKLTWTGTYDPACVTPGTSVSVPPSNPPSVTPPSTSAPKIVSTATPVVRTGRGTGEVFAATINPGGLPTSAHYVYGLAKPYGASAFSPNSYSDSTSDQLVGSDFSDHPFTATASDLTPNRVYHARLVATNSAGTTIGPEQTFTTAPAPPPGQPVVGRRENFSPVSGEVFVFQFGALVPLTQATQLPVGTIIDALHGSVKVIAASGKKGLKYTGVFGGAVFKITQVRTGPNKGLTTLSLVEGRFGVPSYASCKVHAIRSASAQAALSARILQTLRARASGRFRTRGRYAAGTVRGTRWTTTDRCDGTLIAVQLHSVLVKDFVTGITTLVHAGHSYLARARHG